ncbi:thiol reductant ABC exporter subunit CydC [Streptomyces sp. NPDC046716]|uniref:thiol reductant ABC exporter subunit CydC n=1 Tax=Streptomyces sp. NPDC046716 TaxID=3157093 RepID=UPI0033ED37B4
MTDLAPGRTVLKPRPRRIERGGIRALFPLVSVLRTAGPLWRLLPAAALAVLADLAGTGLLALAAWLIARAAQQPPMGALSVAIVAVRTLAVTRGLLRYGERLAGHDVALRGVARLRGRVFGALAARPPGDDARTVRDADAASRLVADVDLVQDALLRVALPALSALAVALAAFCGTFLVSPPAALVLGAGLLVGGLLVPALTAAASARSARAGAALRAELAVRTVDLLDGAADLTVFGAARRETDGAVAAARRLRAHDRGTALANALAAAALTVVQGGTALAVALTCAHTGAAAVWSVTLPLLALAAFEPLTPLPGAAQRLMALPEGARRVRALLRPAGPAAAPDIPVDRARDTAHLSVRDLYVSHRPDGPDALRGVDLDLPPGRRVAVIGASGAGKSTLLAALARFVPPRRGGILLDGTDLADVPEAALRGAVSGALQDAHVFHTSLRNNLVFARPGAPDAELHEALDRAGLLEWVLSLPHGLDTIVGSDGDRLSGGQRRRLVLARALLAAPPVLLLDEPTEGLDPATADAVLADVLTATRGRSLVLVTHRLEGLDALDEVLVMDRGRIVRRGTPDTVLAG